MIQLGTMVRLCQRRYATDYVIFVVNCKVGGTIDKNKLPSLCVRNSFRCKSQESCSLEIGKVHLLTIVPIRKKNVNSSQSSL